MKWERSEREIEKCTNFLVPWRGEGRRPEQKRERERERERRPKAS